MKGGKAATIFAGVPSFFKIKNQLHSPKYVIPFFVIHYNIIVLQMSLLLVLFSHRLKKEANTSIGHLQINSKYIHVIEHENSPHTFAINHGHAFLEPGHQNSLIHLRIIHDFVSFDCIFFWQYYNHVYEYFHFKKKTCVQTIHHNLFQCRIHDKQKKIEVMTFSRKIPKDFNRIPDRNHRRAESELCSVASSLI